MSATLEEALKKIDAQRAAYDLGVRHGMEAALLKGKIFCSKHPDIEALVYQKIPGQTEIKCIWCIEKEARETHD